MSPILTLILKEFKQIFRQREMKAIIFIAPLMQLFVFGYAVNTDLKNIRLAVLDQDRTPAGRALVEAFAASNYFQIAARVDQPSELQEALSYNQADVTLWIPPDYGLRTARGEGAEVALAIDGSNSSLAGRARGYSEMVVQQENLRLLDEIAAKYPQAAARMHFIKPEIRFFYNPQLESRLYMIPGIIALILTIISAFLTGMAVVKEKEAGTLEQLMVTPLTPLQLIAGKTIPFVILAFIEMMVAIAVAIYWFRLPLEGSVICLAVAALLFLLVTLGIGLLVSTISQTQQQAMFTIWFFLVFCILMSGFFFPIENMPEVVRKLTVINPMRYFMAILRGIFLKGSGPTDMASDLAALAAIGVVVFGGAVVRFRKRVK